MWSRERTKVKDTDIAYCVKYRGDTGVEWGELGRGFCDIYHVEAGDLSAMMW